MKDDEVMNTVGCMFVVLFIAGIAMIGVGIWGFIELVQWVTNQ